jgi:hypothetical protein
VGTRIVLGYCKHIEVDANNHSTIATFTFMTPNDIEDFAGLMVRLASGIEVLISVEDDGD